MKTFHSYARNIIEKSDFEWWSENSSQEEGFWNLEVPMKLEEYINLVEKKFDILIIDEGQDFKEFWYEILFHQIKDEGQKFIFLDAMQNIFDHYSTIPNSSNFFHYELPENCRNTQNIVKYLSKHSGSEIKYFEKTPIGSEVVIRSFNDKGEKLRFLRDEISSLIKQDNIDPAQILILLNSKKVNSSISELDTVDKLPMRSLDNKARFQKNTVNYTTINTFKGLEADIVFILDSYLIEEKNKPEKLYTEASRARHELYILSL